MGHAARQRRPSRRRTRDGRSSWSRSPPAGARTAWAGGVRPCARSWIRSSRSARLGRAPATHDRRPPSPRCRAPRRRHGHRSPLAPVRRRPHPNRTPRRAPWSVAHARLVASRDVANTVAPIARARRNAAVDVPPPMPVTSTVVCSSTRPRRSMRSAEDVTRPTAAASVQDSAGRLAGDVDLGERRSRPRGCPSDARPRSRSPDRTARRLGRTPGIARTSGRVDHHLVAHLGVRDTRADRVDHPGTVGATDVGERRRSRHAARDPQVEMVERGCAQRDAHLTVPGLRRGHLAQLVGAGSRRVAQQPGSHRGATVSGGTFDGDHAARSAARNARVIPGRSVSMTELGTADLERGLGHIADSPRDHGTVEMIVRRPAVDAREVVASAEVGTRRRVDRRLLGRTATSFARGRAHVDERPMRRAARRRRRPLAPRGRSGVRRSRPRGREPSARLPACGWGRWCVEVSAKPHTGCSKFSARFGPEALAFVNSDAGQGDAPSRHERPGDRGRHHPHRRPGRQGVTAPHERFVPSSVRPHPRVQPGEPAIDRGRVRRRPGGVPPHAGRRRHERRAVGLRRRRGRGTAGRGPHRGRPHHRRRTRSS